MVRRSLICAAMLALLATLSGCIIHDPGYYPYDRAYYHGTYYPYYGPYLYSPFWFGGYYYFGDVNVGHFHGYRGGGHGRGHR